MKRTLFLVICAATLAAACQKEQSGLIETDKTPATTLTFKASLPETKVAVNTTSGKVTWVSGDSFAFFNTDGTKFEATLSAGEGTSEGTFTCTSFTGTLDSSAPAVYPFAYAGAAGKVVIPHYTAWAEGVPAIMASDVSLSGENVIVDFTHLMSILEITLQDVPAYARAVKFSSAEGQKLSGTYTVNATKDGVTLDSGLSEQVIYFPYKTAYGAEATIKICAPIPSYTYTDLYVSVLDGDEDALEGTTKKVKSSSSDLAVADYRYMPTLNVRSLVGTSRDKYVKVEGVKWAKGNLRAWKSGTTGTGWQSGWNVYGEQWETQSTQYNATSITTLDNANYKEGDVFTHWDYFSWGKIGSASRDGMNTTQINCDNDESFEIVGKVFTGTQGDISKMIECDGDARFVYTDFETAPSICGDVAFWASKGQFRMPTKAEIQKLSTTGGASRAHSHYGYYQVSSGVKVYGILFRSSPSWDTTISDSSSSSSVAFDASDIESGLFLPKIGERKKKEAEYDSITISNYNSWGIYWSGSFGGKVDYRRCAYHLYFVGACQAIYNSTTPVSSNYFGRTLFGNAIRPVYIGE